jgi:hypothetical protein
MQTMTITDTTPAAAAAAQPLPRLFPELTISNFKKHGTGMEGERYSLTILRDGVPTAEVNEDGEGGPLRVEGVFPRRLDHTTEAGRAALRKARAAAEQLETWAREQTGEQSEALATVVEYLLRFHDTDREAAKNAKKGYAASVLILAQPYAFGDEEVGEPHPLRSHFAENSIYGIGSMDALPALLAKTGAVYYYVAEAPADKFVAQDDELINLQGMLRKYRRTDKGVTGVVLMRDGHHAGRVAQLTARRTLEGLRESFGFTQERVVMHEGRS